MKRIAIAGIVVAASVFGVQAKALPRMVVANFRSASGDTFSWQGKNESTAMWAAAVADKLNERFTQSREFTMIDRKFDAEVKDEIARLSDKNAVTGDVVRLCRRLGTDYMVVGDVKFGVAQASGANPITGQALPAVSQRFADVSYRVIHAPTGEIRWADTVTIDSTDAVAADMFTFVALSTDCAARRIAEGVVANLFKRKAADAPAEIRPVSLPQPNTSVRGTGNGGIVTPF